MIIKINSKDILFFFFKIDFNFSFFTDYKKLELQQEIVLKQKNDDVLNEYLMCQAFVILG